MPRFNERTVCQNRTLQREDRIHYGRHVRSECDDPGINLSFLVAQVIGRRYSAVIGFENDADAKKAATLIKKATASKRK
jgi:hypothetical protein